MFQALGIVIWKLNRAYCMGNWRVPAPPVCTAAWTTASWIRYVGLPQLARLAATDAN